MEATGQPHATAAPTLGQELPPLIGQEGRVGPRGGSDATARRKIIPSLTLPGIEARSSSREPSPHTDRVTLVPVHT